MGGNSRKEEKVMRNVKTVHRAMLGAITLMFALSAQEPTCHRCSATFIGTSELQAYLKRAVENDLVDQQVRRMIVAMTKHPRAGR